MSKKLTNGCVALVNRFLPDPFIFCIILSIIVFVAAMPLTKQGPLDMINAWGAGVWGLLSFSMQMALVLVLGNAFAQAPAIKKVVSKIASIGKTPVQGIIVVTFFSLIACWINWGFGLVVVGDATLPGSEALVSLIAAEPISTSAPFAPYNLIMVLIILFACLHQSRCILHLIR